MKPYAAYKDSSVAWLGEMPAHWGAIPIKWLVETPVTDGPHETPEFLSEGIPFVSAEAIKNNEIDFSRVRGFISIEDHQRYSRKYKPRRGDIFMVKAGATTGNVAMVDTDQEFNIWSPLAAIRADPVRAIARYVFYFMLSRNFFQAIETHWSFGTQQNIGMGIIENISMSVPTTDEQTAIADYLDRKTAQIDAVIAKKGRLIELLREERTAVISHAVTKGLNPNAPMKDSHVAWLGEVPDGWKVVKLKFLATKIGSGITPKGGASVYQQAGIPFIRSQNVHFDGLRLDDVAYISEETHQNMIGSKVHSGDVLLNITGASIGRCCTVPSVFGEANVNQHVCIVRPNRLILADFLNAYLSSSAGQSQIFSGEKGISREGLTFEEIKQFILLWPPGDEQTLIINYLKQKTAEIDQTITRTEAQIDLLHEYRTALISAAVTGKMDVSKEVAL